MKILYLHIGMHKTATTSIQMALRANADELGQRGYDVPRSGVSGTTHNNIAFEIRGLPRFNPARGTVDDLVHELSTSEGPRFIVSAEALDHLSGEEIALLARKLMLFDTRIIVYLRRQVDWLQSEWSEMVKLRFYQYDFTTWVQQRLVSDRRLRYFDFCEMWSDCFGRDNVRVRVFEKERFRDRNVFLDFLEACDVGAASGWKEVPNANISPSIKTLEVIRAYVRHYYGVLPENRLLGRCKRIVDFADRNGWNTAPVNLIDRELFKTVEAAFDESNRRVARSYLGAEQLFSGGFEERPITRFDIGDIEVEELLRLVAYLET